MPSPELKIEKLPASRTKCSVTFEKEDVAKAEETALRKLGARIQRIEENS